MNTPFHIVIPARYQSSRLPGKLLMNIEGQTVLERVYRQAMEANPESIIIATDNMLIADHARSFGADVQITASSHQTGTDRIAEVIHERQFNHDAIIVNVQADEPFIPPQLILQLAQCLYQSQSPMATLCWPIETLAQFNNPNVVKVVCDSMRNALYFSRSPIPYHRENPNNIQGAYRHIGLYAYHASFLLKLVHLPLAEVEVLESLEQLRVLHAGYPIRVELAELLPPQDINTTEDLELARQYIKNL